MSKFIAMLSALAMLSTSCIVFADETTSDSYYEDTYYEDTYYEDPYYEDPYYEDPYYDEPFYDEFFHENIESDYGTEIDESYANQYAEDVFIDNSVNGASGEVQVIEITPSKDKSEDNDEEPATTTGVVFTDVPEDAYYSEAVKFCYERGLFNGVSDTEFAPGMTMTRGMFATVFGRIQNADLTNVTLTFEDVKADAYYASYIAWATKEGIMDGYSEDAFGPDDSITREQAAKMLHAYLGNVKNINITDVAADYADMANVSDWAAKAINANTSVGYLRADENNNINPTAELTRADACFAVATTIRLVEALESEGLKDAGENKADEEAIEIKDADKEITPLEPSKTDVDTQAQMSEIPEADKDQVTEDFQPYPGTEYNPIDEEF